MKTRFFSMSLCLALVLAFSLACQQDAWSAKPGQAPQQAAATDAKAAATEINTEYFTLSLSNGWRLLKPAESRNGSVNVLLGSPKNNGAIAINAMKANLDAAQIARNMRANMQKDGAKVEEPTAKDGFQEFGFVRGKANGRAYVGANGKEAAVITIFGDQAAGREVLKNLKAKDARLFPKF